jgi:membrane protease YdiL (CAAX protease family)
MILRDPKRIGDALSLIVLLTIVWFLWPKSPFPVSFSLEGLIGGFVVGIVVFLASSLLTLLISRVNKKHLLKPKDADMAKHNRGLLGNLLFAIVVSAFEELLFRSFLFHYANVFLGTKIAFVISITIFALSHFNNRFIELCFMGAAFLLLMLNYDNVLPPIVAHATNNVATYVIDRLYQSSEPKSTAKHKLS